MLVNAQLSYFSTGFLIVFLLFFKAEVDDILILKNKNNYDTFEYIIWIKENLSPKN